MKRYKKIVGLFCMLVAFAALFAVSSSAVYFDTPVLRSFTQSEEVSVVGDTVSVTVGKSTKLTATLSGAAIQPQFTWRSTDEKVATVDENGNVTGHRVGRVVITASALVGEKELTGCYALSIITEENDFKNYLYDDHIMCFKYSYVDDVYYANDKDCWQDEFGYCRFYDLMAPYVVAMEYDYVRVFFNYDDEDFMVQLWKGQYTPLFFGGEIGVYNKISDHEDVGMFTFFYKAEEQYWPKMEMSIYHQELNGEYERSFTRDYDTYWWITGFKFGQLRIVEPADEVRMISRITFNDSEMATAFTDGLKECGFKQVESKDGVGLDEFCQEGADVYITWQNISEAENSMPVKYTAVALFFFNILARIAAVFVAAGLGSIFLMFLI